MSRVVNINSNQLVKFRNKLEKTSKTAFPNVVRKTLNDVAIDMKKREMPKSAKREFINRRPNFFKAKSRIDFASGRSVSAMSSAVGFVGNEEAVNNLPKQEFGGTIERRTLIATDAARVGKSRRKVVRRKNAMRNIKRIYDPKKVSGANQKERWIKSVIAAGKGGLVRGTYNENIVFRIKSIRKNKSGTVANTEAIYSLEKGRSVDVAATGFMRKASLKAVNKAPDYFIKQAQKRFMR
jgi:hypothetical protein